MQILTMLPSVVAILLMVFLGSASADDQARFVQWLEEEGLPPHDLQITMFDGHLPGPQWQYRGLVTKKAVSMGDKVLAVPRNLLLTSSGISSSAIGGILNDLKATLPQRVVLTLYYLHSLGDPQSPWRAYLDFVAGDARESLVNGTFTTRPWQTSLLFFSDAEIAELQCPTFAHCPILDKLRKTKMELRSVWEVLRPTFEPHFSDGGFTYDAFMWAYTTVTSRAFSMNVTASHGVSLLRDVRDESSLGPPMGPGQAELSFVMAPFAGLFNHHNSVPALQFSYGFNDKDQTLEIFADKDYAAGEQIFISYGVLTNPELLMNYGFVLQNNVFETAGLSFALDDDPSDAASIAWKQRQLEEHGLEEHLQTHVPLTGVPSDEFIAALRIKVYRPPMPLPPPAENKATALNPFKPLSEASEFEVFQSLLLNVEQLLRMYPTSLDDDLHRLGLRPRPAAPSPVPPHTHTHTHTHTHAHPPLTARLAQALSLRIEVKRILHATILRCLRGIAGAFQLVETAQRANATDPREVAMWKHWENGMQRWEKLWGGWMRNIDNVWPRLANSDGSSENLSAQEYIDQAFRPAIDQSLEALRQRAESHPDLAPQDALAAALSSTNDPTTYWQQSHIGQAAAIAVEAAAGNAVAAAAAAAGAAATAAEASERSVIPAVPGTGNGEEDQGNRGGGASSPASCSNDAGDTPGSMTCGSGSIAEGDTQSGAAADAEGDSGRDAETEKSFTTNVNAAVAAAALPALEGLSGAELRRLRERIEAMLMSDA